MNENNKASAMRIIEDITFKTVFEEMKNYRAGFVLPVQIEQYKILLKQMERYSKAPGRVKVRKNLLRLLENYTKYTILN